MRGAQWLSGRVLDLRPRVCGFESHLGHCIVSLDKAHLSLLSTGQTRKTCRDLTEKLLTGMKESNKKKKKLHCCEEGSVSLVEC